MPRKYWLIKSEPDVFSIEDLKNCPNGTEPWDGIRNYQARNFMRDEWQVGDQILFYHSNTTPPGVVGLAEVAGEPEPDPLAWDKKSNYYDEKASPENPRWVRVPVKYVDTFPRTVTLDELKSEDKLAEMRVVQRGNRLSINPVTKAEFEHICKLAKKKAK
ncbi:EVE domain-containing protein [Cerasicoccus fimbriatus]|uniref:EVE domain-containing protein n=1 Tax=Cerasicoccus fimbriatus TaxID=3014554 RepID=UPI0022B51B85|nr:EVE domain-containing protein [Cerasicoccus sp. TK19100]